MLMILSWTLILQRTRFSCYQPSGAQEFLPFREREGGIKQHHEVVYCGPVVRYTLLQKLAIFEEGAAVADQRQ